MVDPSPFVFPRVLLLFVTSTLTVFNKKNAPSVQCLFSWIGLCRFKLDSTVVLVDDSGPHDGRPNHCCGCAQFCADYRPLQIRTGCHARWSGRQQCFLLACFPSDRFTLRPPHLTVWGAPDRRRAGSAGRK